MFANCEGVLRAITLEEFDLHLSSIISNMKSYVDSQRQTAMNLGLFDGRASERFVAFVDKLEDGFKDTNTFQKQSETLNEGIKT